MGNYPMSGFKDYIVDISEKVIIPDGLDITTTDADTLNDWYEDFGFEFIEVDDPREDSSAGYNPATGIISVRVNPKKTSARQLDTLVNHEIIHKMQDVLSSGKMGKQVMRHYDNLKEVERKLSMMEYNEETDTKEYKTLHKKWKKMLDKIKYNNQEEMMTYSYMVIRDRKDHGITSAKDAVKFLADWLKLKDKKLIKKLKNYTKQYWELRDKIK